jgi:hypothetical protein
MVVWEWIQSLFGLLYGRFNTFLQDSLDIDGKLIFLYNEFVAPLPEVIKIAGLAFLSIIIVLGVFSFIKKMLKLFIVIAIILAIIMFLSRMA